MFSRFWRTSEKSSSLLYLPSNLMPVLDLKPNTVGRANAHAFSLDVLVHFLKSTFWDTLTSSLLYLFFETPCSKAHKKIVDHS